MAVKYSGFGNSALVKHSGLKLLWFNPSRQLSIMQLLAHSPSLPMGMGRRKKNKKPKTNKNKTKQNKSSGGEIKTVQ